LREVSHESFVFTSSTFSCWRKSRKKALGTHVSASVFEGCLAWKLVFHNFNFQFLNHVSNESFGYTCFTCSFWWMSCTKASVSQLQLSFFNGCLARNGFLRDSRAKSYVLHHTACLGRSTGKVCRAIGARRSWRCSDQNATLWFYFF